MIPSTLFEGQGDRDEYRVEGITGRGTPPSKAAVPQSQQDATGVEPSPRVPWSRRPTSPQRIRAAERRRRAVELRGAGRTFKQIGEELGVSTQRAHALVHEAIRHDAIADARRFAQFRNGLVARALDQVDQARAAVAHNETGEATIRLARATLELEGLMQLMLTGHAPQHRRGMTGSTPARAIRLGGDTQERRAR